MSKVMVLCALFGSACALEDVSDVELDEAEQEAANTYPWKQPAKWPFAIESPRMVVHYQATGDLATAQTVLADVEDAWTKQITQQGSRAPLDDGGAAGSDGRFDVYLQRGIDSMYVAALAANAATTYNDYSAAMVLDPWGQYGGAEQRPNIFHEFRHASQAADDWYEHINFFEAEATLWETVYYGYARLPYVWADFQAHPEYTPFKNDAYRTWYMYGSALFYLYLRQHVFANSLAFSNQLWLLSRNPSTGGNEPDFADALQTVLAAQGRTLFGELVAFARARYYTGPRHDGTLEGGASIPAVASTTHVRAANATRTTFLASAEVLGTVYVVVQRASTDATTAKVSIASAGNNVKAVVQVVGQGAADRVLDFTAGPATVNYASNAVVLAITMQPANGAFDPDSVGTQAQKATIAIDR